MADNREKKPSWFRGFLRTLKEKIKTLGVTLQRQKNMLAEKSKKKGKTIKVTENNCHTDQAQGAICPVQ